MRYFKTLISQEQFEWYKKTINKEIEDSAQDKVKDIEQALEDQLQEYLDLPAGSLVMMERNLMNFPSIRPLYNELYKETSQEYAGRFLDDLQDKLDAEFDRERILIAVAQSTAGFLGFGIDAAVNSVNKTGKRKVESILKDLQAEGVNDVEEAKKRIRDAYRLIIASRAIRVGRTEIATAANRASWIAARQLQMPLAKVWDSVIDQFTRAGPDYNHVVSNGQARRLEDYFIVSGERLMYPLDPVATIGNRINCRCAMFFTSPDVLNPVEESEA